MKNLIIKTDEVICKRGDAAASMYFIKSGLVGVYADYGKKGRTLLAVLGRGKCFGEMGVIDNQPRSADIVALEDGELIEIEADDFAAFVQENTSDVITIMKGLSERLSTTNAKLEKAARTVSRFVETNDEIKTSAPVKLSAIADFARRLLGLSGQEPAPKTAYAAGEAVFKQGDIGTHMFRILSGEASVVADMGKADETVLATLGKGDIFGEMAVVSEERRSASVLAKTDLTVETVANAKLKSFLTSHPEEAVKILRNISAKLRATTEKYIGTLAAISEFVAQEKGRMGRYIGGDEFMTYADYYDDMVIYNPAIADTLFDPTIFF